MNYTAFVILMESVKHLQQFLRLNLLRFLCYYMKPEASFGFKFQIFLSRALLLLSREGHDHRRGSLESKRAEMLTHFRAVFIEHSEYGPVNPYLDYI